MKKNLLILTTGLTLSLLIACASSSQSSQESQEQVQEIQMLDSLNNELESASSNLKTQTEAIEQSLDSLLEDN